MMWYWLIFNISQVFWIFFHKAWTRLVDCDSFSFDLVIAHTMQTPGFNWFFVDYLLLYVICLGALLTIMTGSSSMYSKPTLTDIREIFAPAVCEGQVAANIPQCEEWGPKMSLKSTFGPKNKLTPTNLCPVNCKIKFLEIKVGLQFPVLFLFEFRLVGIMLDLWVEVR